MACGFKYCQGSGKCFLEGVSPCSAHATDAADKNPDQVGLSVRQMGLTRTGFVRSVLGPEMAELAEVRTAV